MGTDDPVWYVAYGSNLSRERFRAYLEGGRPVGSRRHYAGGRDTSPPRESRVLRLRRPPRLRRHLDGVGRRAGVPRP